MNIAVPKEIAAQETRVALTPESAGKLLKNGHTIKVEQGAGQASNFLDAAYADAGATIVSDVEKLYQEANCILKVQRPMEHPKLGRNELDLIGAGSLLIGFLQPLTNHALIRSLAERKITAFAMESIPRITRAQSMDALSSMSTVAGYKAVLMAASMLTKFFPMFTTAAGTIKPAKVLIIGAGVAGLQAIATARRLGAVVEAFDTRPVVKEQVQSLGASFVELEVDHANAQDAGGYAKELSEDHIRKEKELLAKHCKEADVVITTALIPGKPAPKLITEAMVQSMKSGSVIIDLAAEMGGNCEVTRPGEEATVHGVKICGITNLPALLPYDASAMYSRNVLTLLNHLAPKGELVLNFEDEITRGTCSTHDGNFVSPQVKAIMEAQTAKTPA